MIFLLLATSPGELLFKVSNVCVCFFLSTFQTLHLTEAFKLIATCANEEIRTLIYDWSSQDRKGRRIRMWNVLVKPLKTYLIASWFLKPKDCKITAAVSVLKLKENSQSWPPFCSLFLNTSGLRLALKKYILKYKKITIITIMAIVKRNENIEKGCNIYNSRSYHAMARNLCN